MKEKVFKIRENALIITGTGLTAIGIVKIAELIGNIVDFII